MQWRVWLDSFASALESIQVKGKVEESTIYFVIFGHAVPCINVPSVGLVTGKP